MAATPDLIAAFEDLEHARPAYEEADNFYSGDVGEVYASERVKLLLRKAGADQVEEFNYCHIPVDTVANRLEITSVTVVTDDDQSTKESGDGGEERADGTHAPTATPARNPKTTKAPDAEDALDGRRVEEAQAALDKVWTDNQLDAESSGLHLNVSKNGDCYLIVWPHEDDTGKVTGVDMRVNSALTTRVVYDTEDPLQVAYAIKSWTFDAPDKDGNKVQFTRATLYYDDAVERWISKPGVKGKGLCDPDNWEHYEPVRGDSDDREPWRTEHDYGRVPVFHFRNARPYGRPEHLYAYGPQQLLNKLVQAEVGAIDFQGFPQRYLLMDPTADQPMGNFLDPNHPEDDDDPEGDGNVSQLSGEAMAVWRLFGVKTAGQFDPASADTFLKPFDRFVQAMAELTETPLYRFGSSFAQTPSGAALRVADASTVNKAENRQAAYDAVWEDAFTFALELLGFNDLQVRVGWKPAEQATDFEAWSVVQAKITAGVPQRQALIEAGYTDDQVDEWLQGEAAAQADLLRKVETLNAVAGALQNLGAAATMGVIQPEQVQALIAGLLGGPVEPEPVPAGA